MDCAYTVFVVLADWPPFKAEPHLFFEVALSSLSHRSPNENVLLYEVRSSITVVNLLLVDAGNSLFDQIALIEM